MIHTSVPVNSSKHTDGRSIGRSLSLALSDLPNSFRIVSFSIGG